MPPATIPVLSTYTWNTNAELLVDVAKLYLKPHHWVLDLTPGRGVWGRKLDHRRIVRLQPDDDFHQVPYDDRSFDMVWYDPPYVSTGGRVSSGMQEFLARFGLFEAPRTPKELQAYCNMGAAEGRRVLKDKGLLLWKGKDYVSGGHLFPGTHEIYSYATAVLGMYYQDHFVLARKAPTPQPARTRKDGKPSVQQHARNNRSDLYVFKRKPIITQP